MAEIKFARHQKLPDGYKIEWWECDEMFHWIIDDNIYSEICCSKWMAYRGAWSHFLKNKRIELNAKRSN